MTRVVLIACCKQKLGRAAPARDLYTSPLFRKSLAYAESGGADAVYILSARHGLVELHQVLEPYETPMTSLPRAQRHAWARAVAARLDGRHRVMQTTFVFLAGRDYVDLLLDYFPYAELPLQGLGIGRKLAWLTEHTPEH